ncbi:hypothetical protein NC653_041341 [Populus alba x Populus x berolinensis]|uniref:Uncharacterized protein n=1 Tax=Populus alba x Populus x berolinensis TaxID=444605 RepID=A0AAD6PP35_9ROSI|nr:hypothetical protein NC653_041341 [Populus alba x Populus x berolinensis]
MLSPYSQQCRPLYQKVMERQLKT